MLGVFFLNDLFSDMKDEVKGYKSLLSSSLSIKNIVAVSVVSSDGRHRKTSSLFLNLCAAMDEYNSSPNSTAVVAVSLSDISKDSSLALSFLSSLSSSGFTVYVLQYSHKITLDEYYDRLTRLLFPSDFDNRRFTDDLKSFALDLRSKYGLTYKELSERTGISKGTMLDYAKKHQLESEKGEEKSEISSYDEIILKYLKNGVPRNIAESWAGRLQKFI